MNYKENSTFSLGKEQRLLTKWQFSAVFQAEAKFSHSKPLFTILSIANELEHPRLGLVVAKKNFKLAHDRNRVKRKIREYFRLAQHRLPNIDLVILPKSRFNQVTTAELEQQLEHSLTILTSYFKKQGERNLG